MQAATIERGRSRQRDRVSGDGIIDAVQLDTDVAGIFDVPGNVLELVYRDR